MFLEPGNSYLQQYGTKNGLNFLIENEKVGLMFSNYLGKLEQMLNLSCTYTILYFFSMCFLIVFGYCFIFKIDSPKMANYRVCDVVKLFNKKYSKLSIFTVFIGFFLRY